MSNRPIHFPGLNGLRAIAAIGVMVAHITMALKDFNLKPDGISNFMPYSWRSIAEFGVTTFFVLSGFLITYLLQAEKQIQSIDIKKFYMRRILRIWPLYYFYLATAVLTILIFRLDLNINSLLLYLFYAANIPSILNTTLPFLYHYWSLGVEEQFYLFWPLFNKKLSRYFISVIVLLILTLSGIKVWFHFIYPDSLLAKATQINLFHCLLVGALGAMLYRQKHKLFLKLTDNKISQSIGWLIILSAFIGRFHIASVIDNELISIVALVLIIGQIKIKNRIINLETKAFDFLGKISYGIYVYHPLLIFLFAKILSPVLLQPTYKYLLVYFITAGATILLSHLSYNYFEKYFLNLKKKYTVVHSVATKYDDLDKTNQSENR